MNSCCILKSGFLNIRKILYFRIICYQAVFRHNFCYTELLKEILMKTKVTNGILLLFLAASLMFVSSCTSSKKYFQKGQYDLAINKAVKKIRKNPTKEKEIIILDKSYKLANQQDNDRISFLKKEGNPDIWEEVFDRYSTMKRRQELVRTVLPLNLGGKQINYSIVDYDMEIINAKKNAAEYFYAHGRKLMEQGDKVSARKAYDEFMKVKSFYANYQDVDKLINEARFMGISRAQISLKNESMMKITKEFAEKMLDVDIEHLNSMWSEYYTEDKGKDFFDYNVIIRLKIIDVSPEKEKEEQIVETKEIQDGYEYVLDDNGNVMKDSLGNDIKVPKHKTIMCKLIKVNQSKAAHIEGKIEYVRNFDGKT
ncbi:MAG: hypothetical protein C0594_07805, partial [Marinilabiliales bacterium]